MPAFTPNLNLYKPGGGSTGLILPDEVVDIDRINANSDLIDTFAGQTKIRLDNLEANTGLVLLRPTSVVGGVLQADGSVKGTVGQAAISLNGIFSAAYRAYRLVFKMRPQSGGAGIDVRLRSAGVDFSGNSYRYQSIFGSNANNQEIGNPQTRWRVGATSSAGQAGSVDIFDPATTGSLKGAQGIAGMLSGAGFGVTLMGGGLEGQDATVFDGVTVLLSTDTMNNDCFVKAYAYK